MTLRTRFENFFVYCKKNKAEMIVSFSIVVVLFLMISLAILNQIDDFNKLSKRADAIQLVCDHEFPFSRAVKIGGSDYCETSSHVLYTVELRCGADDPNCVVATMACNKLNFKKALRIDNGVIICEDIAGNQINIRL